jgi:hypothetical protein
MRIGKTLVLLIALGIAVTSLSACVLEHRRDGGFTVRPIHW